MPAQPPLPEPASQRHIAALLILLAALTVIFLFRDLARRPPGKSRVDWPAPAPVKP